MNYKEEMLRLKNGSDSRYTVSIYKNKKEALIRKSENAGDEEEIKEAYQYIAEELEYLADDTIIYEVDTHNGFPEYFDNAEEAYHSFF